MADIEKLDLSMAGERCDDAVLPCPFCGSKNIAYGKYEHTAGRRYAIVCMNCMAQIDPGWAQSWGAVQGMWNHRAQPANEPLTRDCVEEAPAADVAQVVHGRWILLGKNEHDYETSVEEKCSLCGRYVYRYDTELQDNYCPNCGAKMDDEA